MTRKAGFGRNKETEGPYEKFRGKYVRVLYGNSTHTMGRVERVSGEIMVLGDNLTMENNLILGPLFKINYNSLGEEIVLGSIQSVEETSLENIINYCVIQNEQNARTYTEQRLKIKIEQARRFNQSKR